jgi:predicted TIM-barrel fold metal-dependent hydrolase
MTYPPRGACDCHTHVIGPKSRYPLVPKRSYTPVDAPIETLAAMLQRCGMDRVVLVQTSIFGTDNSCTLDGLAWLGKDRARAVVVPDFGISTEEIDRWHDAGVRGARLNFASIGTPSADDIRDGIRRILPICERHGWHLQFLLPPGAYPAIAGDLKALPIDTVIDHFGLIRPLETDADPVDAIVGLLESGKSWIKISGTYRLVPDRKDPSIGALARRMAAVNPDRLVFATDWPHPPKHNSSGDATDEEAPYRDIDTPDLVHDLRNWFEGDEEMCRRILVDNAARLYDFA